MNLIQNQLKNIIKDLTALHAASENPDVLSLTDKIIHFQSELTKTYPKCERCGRQDDSISKDIEAHRYSCGFCSSVYAMRMI